MSPQIEFKSDLVSLFFLGLIPVFLFIIAIIVMLIRGISFKGLFALVAIVIGTGVFSILLAILLPAIYHTRQATVAPIATPVLPPIIELKTAENPLPSPDLLSDAPLVARKPHESVPEFPATVAAEVPIPSNGVAQQSNAALPEWVVTGLEHTKQNEDNFLESSRLVFQSGLFATREEALSDALTKAMEHMQSHLTMRYPRLKANMWVLNPDLVRYTAYRRAHYQTIEHDFGKLSQTGKAFKQDMYRAYLEIDDSPATREVLWTKWKQNVGNERTAWLGGGFGLITLLCAGVAVYLRALHPRATMKKTSSTTSH